MKGTDIFPRGPLDGPWAFLQKRPSVHANSGLRAIIEEGLDYERLSRTPSFPLEVVTTSLTDGRERWIGHGPATEAILASSAIPSIFPPVTIDGDVLVDGGVVRLRADQPGLGRRLRPHLCVARGPLHYHPRPPRRPAEAAAADPAVLLRGHPRPLRARAHRTAGGSRGDRFQWWRRSFGPSTVTPPGTAAPLQEGRAEVPRHARSLISGPPRTWVCRAPAASLPPAEPVPAAPGPPASLAHAPSSRHLSFPFSPFFPFSLRRSRCVLARTWRSRVPPSPVPPSPTSSSRPGP